jgi:hypothetical protein
MDFLAVDWTVVEAIAESAGAIGVVISLLYLARQMHLSNRISQAEAYRAVWLKSIDIQLGWARDPEFRRVLPKIYSEQQRQTDLQPAERTIATLYMNAFLSMRALLHQEIGQGILPASAREHLGESTVRLPYMRDIWTVVRNDYPADFRRHYEAMIAEIEETERADAARTIIAPRAPEPAVRPEIEASSAERTDEDDVDEVGSLVEADLPRSNAAAGAGRVLGWEWLAEGSRARRLTRQFGLETSGRAD